MSEDVVINTSAPLPYTKPLPQITPEAKPFWDAAREHRLLIQRSVRKGKYVFYPRAISPYGPNDELTWVEASGKGTIYSYTVARRPTAPQWAGEPPLIIAIVQLAEGVRMTTNIVGYAPEDIRIGMAVHVVFDDVTPEVTLVKFGPPPPPPPALEAEAEASAEDKQAEAPTAEAEPIEMTAEASIDELPPSPNVDVEPIPEAI